MRLASSVKLTAFATAAILLATPLPAPAATFWWDPGHTASTSGGGAGTWNSGNSNWYNGTADVSWASGDDALFGGPVGGAINLSSAQNANSLTFNTTGYAIAGSALTLSGGSVTVAPGASATVNATVNSSPNINLLGGGTLTLGAALTPAAGASINIAAGSLVIAQSTGTVSFNNGGALNGNLVITNSIRVNFDTLAGSSSAATYNGSGAVQVQTSLTTISNVSGSYGGAIGAGIKLNSLNLPFNKTDVTQSNLAFPATNSFVTPIGATKNGTTNENLVINGVISGNSDVVLATNSPTGGGAGIMQLNAQNTYTGATLIDGNGPDVGNGGSVILGISNALPVSTDVVFGFLTPKPSTSPELDLNGFNQQIGSLSLSSNVTASHQKSFLIANNLNGTTSTLTVSGSTTPGSAFAGNIVDNSTGSGGTIALVKAGPNTLVLAGTNTFSGGTTVNQGTLFVNGSIASLATVNSGGILGGTGTLASVVVTSGGTLSPGDAPGILTFTGNLTLDQGAELSFVLDTIAKSDKISMTSGSLALGNQDFSDFNFSPTANFGQGVYTLIDASSISGSLGTSSSGTINGLTATLSVQGNDLLLNVTPEPSTLLLLFVGAVAFAGYYLRSRPPRTTARPELQDDNPAVLAFPSNPASRAKAA